MIFGRLSLFFLFLLFICFFLLHLPTTTVHMKVTLVFVLSQNKSYGAWHLNENVLLHRLASLGIEIRGRSSRNNGLV